MTFRKTNKPTLILISCALVFIIGLLSFFVYRVYSSTAEHNIKNGVLTIKELGISLPIAGYDDIYYTHDINAYHKVYLHSSTLESSLNHSGAHSTDSDNPCIKNPLGTIKRVEGETKEPTNPTQAWTGTSYNIAKQFDGFAVVYTNSDSTGPTACNDQSAQLQKQQIEAIVNAIPNTMLIKN